MFLLCITARNPKQKSCPLESVAGRIVSEAVAPARNVSKEVSGYHSRVESDRAEAAAIAADSVSAAATGV